MEYYKKYDKSNSLDKCGIFLHKNKKFYVNGKEVENNRAISGDCVFVREKKVINILTRNVGRIVGILRVSSHIKYGRVRKNIPLYLFKPSDKKYPDFYVASRTREKHDVYCIVELHSWTTKMKYPRGNCIKIIGKVGVLENEYEHLMELTSLNYKRWKDDKYKDFYLKEEKKLNISKIDYKVFSIDPEGSLDIDDALHIVQTESGYQLGIHIADVTYYLDAFKKYNIDLGTKLEEGISKRLSTIYAPHKKINMLPDIFADNICSLLEGKNRRAVSLIIEYDIELNMISHNIKRTIVKNTKNFTYNVIDSLITENIPDDLDILCKISGTNDSHKLVEYYMILANRLIGKRLYDIYNDEALIRVHEKSDKDMVVSISDNINDYLKLRVMKAAKYKLVKNCDNYKHYGLGTEFYTHFTSPIRRYADIVVHRLLLSNMNANNMILEEINELNKRINKFKRNLRRLDVIKKLEEEGTISKKVDGYIVDIYNNKLTVYIPELKLEERVSIISNRLDKISSYKQEGSQVKVYCNDEVFEYTIYDKINLKVTPFIKANNWYDKLCINIILDNYEEKYL